jgi:hypothetical protein
LRGDMTTAAMTCHHHQFMLAPSAGDSAGRRDESFA